MHGNWDWLSFKCLLVLVFWLPPRCHVNNGIDDGKSFPKDFQCLLLGSIREITTHRGGGHIKCISQGIRLESYYYSLIHGVHNGYGACRHESDINLIVHLHQSSWVTRCVVDEWWYMEMNPFFSDQWVSARGLKYSVTVLHGRCAITLGFCSIYKAEAEQI